MIIRLNIVEVVIKVLVSIFSLSGNKYFVEHTLRSIKLKKCKYAHTCLHIMYTYIFYIYNIHIYLLFILNQYYI